MTKFGFIVEGNRVFTAGIKPHLAFARGLIERGHEACFYVLNKSDELLKELNDRFLDSQIIQNSKKKSVDMFKDTHPDILFSDDYGNRILKLIELKRALRIPAVTYSHVFNGALSLFGRETGIPFPEMSKMSLEGWSAFSREHVMNLRMSDYLISNSSYTESMNWLLFGTESDGVIYPPTDTSLFRYSDQERKSDSIVIYSGNEYENAERTDAIIKELLKEGWAINLFGTNLNQIRRKYTRKDRVRFLLGMNESDLAKLLSKARSTIDDF